MRALSAVHDLGNFQRFMRLAASRSGQLLNLNALAHDCGIARPTAAAWINVLVDLLLEEGGTQTLVEIKSGQTFQGEWLRGLATVDRHLGGTTRRGRVDAG